MKKVLPFYSFSPDKNTLAKMLDFYRSFQGESPNEYIALFARGEDFVVSIYKPNKKGEVKVTFQGVGAIGEARIWDPTATNQSVQPTLPPRPDPFLHRPFHSGPVVLNRYPQIGSDEVGTGDFYGPICVCAAYVEEKQLPLISELGIRDSKKMEDGEILKLGPRLIHEFDYSQLALPNEKYNAVHDEFNMNAIKAKLHNRCDLNLRAKHPAASIYQDQFAEATLYYRYLAEESEVVRDITFRTQGESLFPSVALASVIARYSFLRKMQEMSDHYGVSFPFGAGEEVDRFTRDFVARFGREELVKTAKLNFANYKKIT